MVERAMTDCARRRAWFAVHGVDVEGLWFNMQASDRQVCAQADPDSDPRHSRRCRAGADQGPTATYKVFSKSVADDESMPLDCDLVF